MTPTEKRIADTLRLLAEGKLKHVKPCQECMKKIPPAPRPK